MMKNKDMSQPGGGGTVSVAATQQLKTNDTDNQY